MSKLQKRTLASKAQNRLERMDLVPAAVRRRQRRLLSAASVRAAIRRNDGRRLFDAEDHLLKVEGASAAGPETIAEALAKGQAAERKQIQQLTEKELLDKTLKELLIICLMAHHFVLKHLPEAKNMKELMMVLRLSEIINILRSTEADLSASKRSDN